MREVRHLFPSQNQNYWTIFFKPSPLNSSWFMPLPYVPARKYLLSCSLPGQGLVDLFIFVANDLGLKRPGLLQRRNDYDICKIFLRLFNSLNHFRIMTLACCNCKGDKNLESSFFTNLRLIKWTA